MKILNDQKKVTNHARRQGRKEEIIINKQQRIMQEKAETKLLESESKLPEIKVSEEKQEAEGNYEKKWQINNKNKYNI